MGFIKKTLKQMPPELREELRIYNELEKNLHALKKVLQTQVDSIKMQKNAHEPQPIENWHESGVGEKLDKDIQF